MKNQSNGWAAVVHDFVGCGWAQRYPPTTWQATRPTSGVNPPHCHWLQLLVSPLRRASRVDNAKLVHHGASQHMRQPARCFSPLRRVTWFASLTLRVSLRLLLRFAPFLFAARKRK